MYGKYTPYWQQHSCTGYTQVECTKIIKSNASLVVLWPSEVAKSEVGLWLVYFCSSSGICVIYGRQGGRGRDHIQLTSWHASTSGYPPLCVCVWCVCKCVELDNKMRSILISAGCVRALIMTTVPGSSKRGGGVSG